LVSLFFRELTVRIEETAHGRWTWLAPPKRRILKFTTHWHSHPSNRCRRLQALPYQGENMPDTGDNVINGTKPCSRFLQARPRQANGNNRGFVPPRRPERPKGQRLPFTHTALWPAGREAFARLDSADRL
jgi:hypothetical protein